MISFSTHGEMSERFKEPVLKTGDGATHRGFESHSLRQTVRSTRQGWILLFHGHGIGRSGISTQVQQIPYEHSVMEAEKLFLKFRKKVLTKFDPRVIMFKR